MRACFDDTNGRSNGGLHPAQIIIVLFLHRCFTAVSLRHFSFDTTAQYCGLFSFCCHPEAAGFDMIKESSYGSTSFINKKKKRHIEVVSFWGIQLYS